MPVTTRINKTVNPIFFQLVPWDVTCGCGAGWAVSSIGLIIN
jgi:hypothetical protein